MTRHRSAPTMDVSACPRDPGSAWPSMPTRVAPTRGLAAGSGCSERDGSTAAGSAYERRARTAGDGPRSPPPDPVSGHDVFRGLSRSGERRLRSAADERGARVVEPGLRLRRGNFLLRLLPVRGAEQL